MPLSGPTSPRDCARARLALGQLEGAEADAAGAYRRKPSPSRERLWVTHAARTAPVDDLLAQSSGRSDDPSGRRALLERRSSRGRKETPGPRRGNRFATVGFMDSSDSRRVLSALNDPAAEAEASRAIELTPDRPTPTWFAPGFAEGPVTGGPP